MLGNNRGQSMLEYILIVVFVVVAGMLVWRSFGATVAEKVDAAGAQIEALDVEPIKPSRRR